MSEKEQDEVIDFMNRLTFKFEEYNALRSVAQGIYDKLHIGERPISPDRFYLHDVYRCISFEEFKRMSDIMDEIERFLFTKDDDRNQEGS